MDICFDEYNHHGPPQVRLTCMLKLFNLKNFFEQKNVPVVAKFYICSFSYVNHKENKEKDTTDHEGSEEITQEQQYSQRYVYYHFLSQFLSNLLVFYIAILQP